MSTHNLMTEQVIQNYLSSVDFKSDALSVKKIKEDLFRLIGETPAIQVKWNAVSKMNEMTGDSERVESVESVVVAYNTGDYDDNNNPIVKKIEFYV